MAWGPDFNEGWEACCAHLGDLARGRGYNIPQGVNKIGVLLDLIELQAKTKAYEVERGMLAALKVRLDTRLNNVLCEMKPDYDDSIVGFNEAWDIMRKTFNDTAPPR